ncbi:MAG: hypothetical protein LBK66_03670 [Spirochaetaceae bacterium]|nr:hypothetical protein [Spirochaetaceae bacterium]
MKPAGGRGVAEDRRRRAVDRGGATIRQRFAMMRGNSAPLLNQNMSHKLRELTRIIGLKAKPPTAAINLNAASRPTRREATSAKRMKNPLAG